MVSEAGLPSAHLREEGVEGVVPSSNCLLTRSCLYSRLVFGGQILRHIWQRIIIIINNFIKNNFIVMHEEHLVRRHLTIRLDAMFKAIKFPAGVADLATGLPNVD